MQISKAIFTVESLNLNAGGNGMAVIDPRNIFNVNVVKRGTTREFSAKSSVAERFLHEVFGHGGSYINLWAGAEDANAIQTTNLYHRIKGDNLLRTGSDHDSFFLKNPNVKVDPYYWPYAIDQNPNITIPVFQNADLR